ncbi:cation:proton antiporter [Actinocorallia populi]|uniref:cation:proton antiporter n=1 Tax=Actinocorallia populi TaxID=2079200 RepID=UPI000D08F137|nr:monovalent cation/H(+) antiporter subunit G [Actinocorallia populi]
MTVLTVAGNVLVVLGTGLIAIGTLGLVRLPDSYNRANATAKAAATGVVCVLLGALALMPGPLTACFLLLGVALQLLTTPFGAYTVGHAAYRSGAPLAASTHRDDLREALRERGEE